MVIALIVGALYKQVTPLLGLEVSLPDVCYTYDKYYMKEIVLFLSGALFHVICEVSGVNAWYVK
jgi:hypothetical protein